MISRRTLLGSIAGCAATTRWASGAPRTKLRELSYGQVKLTSGPVAEMYRRMRAHYLTLDEDRLLKVYRQRAGLPAPGRDMGGWYDADGFVPGHLLGQFISGLSRLHAATGDAECAAKARRLVHGYAEAFEKDGDPYAGRNASTWACYIFDKYIVGLLDAASLANSADARALLPRVVEAALPSLPDHTFDRVGVKNPPYDEPYVLPENLFRAHAATKDARYLELAKRYLLDRDFFDPLARGENILPGKHGYSHVIALSSGAQAYERLGDEKYLRALRNAWGMIETTQQFASGAWAPREQFVRPGSGELAASLTATRDHFETPCCFYAHAKLARYLTGFTGAARYGDGLERVLVNTILGALDPDDDGGYFYYSDYQSAARKRYYQRKWPCCAGTLLQSAADYPLNYWFQDADGVCAILYGGNEARTTVNGVAVTLAEETAYPESEEIAIRVEPRSAVAFTVSLRIPGWLERAPEIAVNGKRVSVAADPGSFAAIRRTWRKGDRIEMKLPFSFRTVPIEDAQRDTVALMYGPVMLTAIDAPDPFAMPQAAIGRLAAVAGAPLEFTCETRAGAVRMRPFYRVRREVYSTYFRLLRDA